MERMNEYRKIIKEELNLWAGYQNPDMPEIEYQLVVDKAEEQFILLSVGWHNNTYVHNWLYHLQIKDNKIWIHEDLTDVGIAAVLEEKGVPKSDIVLGFVEPFLREKQRVDKLAS